MFTNKEIDILIEGVREWKTKGTSEYIINSILTACLPDKKEDKESFEQKQKEERKKLEDEMKSKEDTAILLQAKLIQMKNKEEI